MESVVNFFQRLMPSASAEGISRALGVIIAVVLLSVSTIIALTTETVSSNDTNDGSSEDSPILGVLQPGDYIPDFNRAQDDLEIKTSLLDFVNASRTKANLAPAFEDPTLTTLAQLHADENARKGTYTELTDQDVYALRAQLPSNEASAKQFYFNWLNNRDSHCTLASHFDAYGVGVASANDTTFAVIYIRGKQADHSACAEVS